MIAVETHQTHATRGHWCLDDKKQLPCISRQVSPTIAARIGRRKTPTSCIRTWDVLQRLRRGAQDETRRDVDSCAALDRLSLVPLVRSPRPWLARERALVGPASFPQRRGVDVEVEDRVQSECKDEAPCNSGGSSAGCSGGTCPSDVESAPSDCSMSSAVPPDEGTSG